METAQGMGPEQMVASLTAGIQNAFVFGLIMACIGLLCSLFIRKAK